MKKSFFEKLTGAVRLDEDNNETKSVKNPSKEKSGAWMEEDSNDGQLAVDVHQTPTEIIIKAMIAGVRPEDLDVSITRDMVTLKGRREESHEVAEEDYFCRELYWGSFSRTILLPQEVEPEEAEAIEKNGMLTIKLPKINKEKQTKLKIRSGN